MFCIFLTANNNPQLKGSVWCNQLENHKNPIVPSGSQMMHLMKRHSWKTRRRRGFELLLLVINLLQNFVLSIFAFRILLIIQNVARSKSPTTIVTCMIQTSNSKWIGKVFAKSEAHVESRPDTGSLGNCKSSSKEDGWCSGVQWRHQSKVRGPASLHHLLFSFSSWYSYQLSVQAIQNNRHWLKKFIIILLFSQPAVVIMS